MAKEIKGILPPIVTPFDKNNKIDEAGLRSNVNFLIKNGVHGLIPCGSTGEYTLMTYEERNKVNEIVIDEVNGKVPVIAGTTAVSTEDAVTLTKQAKDMGADAVMVAPSYYFKPTDKELYGYYGAIAGVGIQIILYNVPVTVKVDMSPQFMVKLAEDFDNIRYVKEATGFVDRVHEIIRFSNGKLTVFNGWDIITLESFANGAKGWIAAPANFMPKQCVELYKSAVEKNDFQKAKKLYYKMLPTLNLVEGSGKFVQYVKAGVELIGQKAGLPRKPLLPIDENEKEVFKKSLAELGVI